MLIRAVLTALATVLAACSASTEPRPSAEDATVQIGTSVVEARSPSSVSQSISTSEALAPVTATDPTLPRVAPPPPRFGWNPPMEQTAEGTLVTISFEPGTVRGLCWDVSVRDGVKFVETFVAGVDFTADEAKQRTLTTFTVDEETGLRFVDSGAVLSCPTIGYFTGGTYFLYFPAGDLGLGTFRVCQREDCFQFESFNG